MFLFDVSEESSVAVVTFGAGADVEFLFVGLRFLLEHQYIEFY